MVKGNGMGRRVAMSDSSPVKCRVKGMEEVEIDGLGSSLR